MSALLQRYIAPLEVVGDVRQWGLMVGIELVRQRRPRALFATAERVPHKIVAAARRRGVIIRPLGNVMILMPPLSVTAAELETLCRVTAEAIVEALRL
jgi:adenosylmethionine-8-amino-7-oxononanoate aminotransferase